MKKFIVSTLLVLSALCASTACTNPLKEWFSEDFASSFDSNLEESESKFDSELDLSSDSYLDSSSEDECSQSVESVSSSEIESSEDSSSTSGIYHEHEYVRSKILPTCSEVGYTRYYCVCGDEYVSDYVSATDEHEYSTLIEEQQPTCTEMGTKVLACAVCQKKNIESVPALEHIEVEHQGKSPTCVDLGWDKYITCAREGCSFNTYKELEPTLEHVWNEGEIIQEADCLSSGEVQYTCVHCSATYVDILAQLIHDYRLISTYEATEVQAKHEVYACYTCNDQKVIYQSTNNTEPVTEIRVFTHDDTNLAYQDVGKEFTVEYVNNITLEVGADYTFTFTTDLMIDPKIELICVNGSQEYIYVDGTTIIGAVATPVPVIICIQFYHIETDYILYIVNVNIVPSVR